MDVSNFTIGTSNDTTTNTTTTSGNPLIATTLKSLILAITIFANLTGNALALFVIHRVRKMNPVTKVFMTSMTSSDLCTGVFLCIPSFAAIVAGRWPLGDVMCSFNAVCMVAFSITTFVSLLNVTIERFIAVTRPFQYDALVTVSRARVVTILTWILAIVLALLAIRPGRTSKYNYRLHACLDGPADRDQMNYQGALYVILFIIAPFVITIAMFLRLYSLASHHAAQIAAQNQIAAAWDHHRRADKPNDGIHDNNHRNHGNTLRADRKAFITFFIMTMVLAVSNSPIILVLIYQTTTKYFMPTPFIFVAMIMVYANTVWNCVIYYARNTAVRDTTKQFLRTMFRMEPNLDLSFSS